MKRWIRRANVNTTVFFRDHANVFLVLNIVCFSLCTTLAFYADAKLTTYINGVASGANAMGVWHYFLASSQIRRARREVRLSMLKANRIMKMQAKGYVEACEGLKAHVERTLAAKGVKIDLPGGDDVIKLN